MNYIRYINFILGADETEKKIKIIIKIFHFIMILKIIRKENIIQSKILYY